MKSLTTHVFLVLISVSSSASENTYFEDLLLEFDNTQKLPESFVKHYLGRGMYGQYTIEKKIVSDEYVALEIGNSNGVGYFSFIYTFTKSGKRVSYLPFVHDSDCDGGTWELKSAAWSSDTEFSITTTTIDSCNTSEYILDIKDEFYLIESNGHISKTTGELCPASPYEYLSSLKLSDGFLDSLTKSQLSVYRNSIFAKYGYKFSNPSLSSYFSSCSWYNPSDVFSVDTLNDIEKFNISRIRHFESPQ